MTLHRCIVMFVAWCDRSLKALTLKALYSPDRPVILYPEVYELNPDGQAHCKLPSFRNCADSRLSRFGKGTMIAGGVWLLVIVCPQRGTPLHRCGLASLGQRVKVSSSSLSQSH